MPYVNFRDVGNYGLVLDRPGHELPPEVWTSVNNVVMKDGHIAPILGEVIVEGPPPVAPHYLFSSPGATEPYWVYTNLTKVYAVSAGVHTDITRLAGNYTGAVDNRWNGGWLNGVMVLNNHVDHPQVWSPVSVGTKLINLPNWNTNWRAKVIRPHRNFYMALNITKTSVNYPTMVKWSDTTDPGQYPGSWDEADPTKLAGEMPLSDTPGHLVDGRSVSGAFLTWKTDALFRLDRIPTRAVFQETAISLSTGLLAQECAQEFRPGNVVFWTRDLDIAITDGQTVQSIIDSKIRSAIQKTMNTEFMDRCFVVPDYVQKEVWFCYPRQGSFYCNAAWVWRFVDNTWSHRFITNTLDIKAGVYDQNAISEAWDDQTDSWQTVNRAWGTSLYVQGSYRMLGAFPLVGEIREMNMGHTAGPSNIASYVERTGLAVVGTDRMGQPKVDPNKIKLVTEIHPIIGVTQQLVSMTVSVGAQDNPNAPVYWYPPQNFNPKFDTKVDVEVEGPYVAVRFDCYDAAEWKIHGYTMLVHVVGDYAS